MSATSIHDLEAPELDPRVARSRRRLLTAATDLLVELGPRGVTVDAVSERSGVAKSTLYRHWESREALLVDVMRSNVPRVEPPDPTLGFEVSLRALVREVACTLADPEWARILPALLSLKQTMPELQELTDLDTEHKLDALQQVLRLGVAEGRLPPDVDAHRVAHVLIGPILSATIGGTADDIAAIADFAVDTFIRAYTP